MIRLLVFGVAALAFAFSARVMYRLEKRRREAERDAARGWRVAAHLQLELDAMRDEESARIEEIARPLLREMRQGEAVQAARARNAHRGSTR